jgi:3-dehydroquinate synthase
VDEAVAAAWPGLAAEVAEYFMTVEVECRGLHVLPGGEPVKADETWVHETWRRIDEAHLDRHSYVLAIGGGAFLDAVGFAAATAHRGVRLVRFPTTTLAQDDSGVGVKCAINAFGKKNWIGAFAVPFAVINDFRFLDSLDEETKRAGLIEAVKVALVKDAGFFHWIEDNLTELGALEPSVLEACVEKSALLHTQHIASGGDPFETGSSRPLDFGHWAAHKLEALTGYKSGWRWTRCIRCAPGWLRRLWRIGFSRFSPACGSLSITRRWIGWMKTGGGACSTGWMSSASTWAASSQC